MRYSSIGRCLNNRPFGPILVPAASSLSFIAAFTAPGEIVADFFAGSGMTGLAALRQSRRAKLSDIAVLGRHIAQGCLTKACHTDLRRIAGQVMNRARAAIGISTTSVPGAVCVYRFFATIPTIPSGWTCWRGA